eukprot:comp18733_c0_seq1/m.20528 comp18733_c0_seq1/g.20528  ORF comp18733_c0_seq1/g.20528 comp18733_c0_seq1/m.20528 type:complete len:361 (-) comp18733_c0_seq1:227-1309(-)
MVSSTLTTVAAFGAVAVSFAHASSIRLESAGNDVGERLVLDPKKIEAINSAKLSWRAVDAEQKTHPFYGMTMKQFKRLINKPRNELTGTNDRRGSNHVLPFKNYTGIDFSKIPDHFDAREKWYDCQTVPLVRDQGNCGSCWAFGTTTPMSDRLCIASNGTYQDLISARDLMACCDYCSGVAGGCEGGDAQDAYHYWMTTGIVSGDNYGSQLGCQPYPIPINLHHGKVHVVSPTCIQECTNEHTRPYAQDRFKAKEAYRIPALDIKAAQWEIMTHGPITGVYDVYDDFMVYKDGVYVHNDTSVAGGHDVTLIGWGEENGVKYWLAKNSWNRLWGHHGFFKIRRGTNECNMESYWMAGIPDV